MQSLGIIGDKDKFTFDELLNQEFKLLTNDAAYTKVDYQGTTRFIDTNVSEQAFEDGLTLKIVGIVRVNKDTATGSIQGAIGYHKSLQDYVLKTENDNISSIVKWQNENRDINCFTGKTFVEEVMEDNTSAMPDEIKEAAEQMFQTNLSKLGANMTPTAINIYPKDFDSKEKIKQHLEEYNKNADADKGETPVYYSDMMGLMVDSMNILVDAISYVLIAFTSISLIVSSIMIGVITYISVLERTKEIGILKSLGARKKDISRVFNAESLTVGLIAGALGILITLVLSIPLNIILSSLTSINGLVALNPLHGLALVLISMLLTFVAGLIPSRIAAKKDAVVALRTE